MDTIEQKLRESRKRGKMHGEYLIPVMIPLTRLIPGAYYIGASRNANVARWTGKEFKHWRLKFQREFIETIKHPEQDEVFDCFVPVATVMEFQVRVIPLSEVESREAVG